MSEEALMNLKLFHVIIYMITLFVFIGVSIYGVRFPDNKKYWTRMVFPSAMTNCAVFLLYTLWR